MLAFTLILLCLSLTACLGEKHEVIAWEDIILGNMLPTPPADKGDINTNTQDHLRIDMVGITDKQYADYIEACKEKGFNTDEKLTLSTFCAFNNEGYELSLSYYSSKTEMTITLKSPMKMAPISWPTSTAGKQLPIPQSSVGKFSYEQEDSFYVYVGNTPKADFTQYVKQCSDAGFTANYKKGDDYYYADNAEGWHVDIRYEGNNVMSVSLKAPKEAEDTLPSDAISSAPETDNRTSVEESSPAVDINILDPEFKAEMDSYEEFIDEYVAFMKEYKANPADISLLADYTKYMSKYADLAKSFEKWDNEDLNAAELAYYTAVQARVSKKLLEAAV